MNLYGLRQLRCPQCQGLLDLHVFAEEGLNVPAAPLRLRAPEADDAALTRIVRSGLLVCPSCAVWYPIESYVPVMLVFKLPFHDRFRRQYAEQFRDWANLSPPRWSPERGERSVQQTFTEEWDAVRESELTFSYDRDDLRQLHRTVWLQWDEQPPADVKRVLNVGCGGQGGEAAALYEISQAEVFGIDLTPMLLHAAPRRRHQPLLHLVVASLFHLPFAEASFDLVYSQGVLHHTYSTYEAFRNCTRYVRPGGEICIWVYGLEDHLAGHGLSGWVQRLKYYGEEYLGLRWAISHSPAWLRGGLIRVLSLLAHPFFKRLKRHGPRWTLANTEHSVRDRLTPRYAHKHSFNEVIEWYEQQGFTTQVHSPSAYRRLFGRSLWGVGLKGTKREVSGS
jgi:SAM-dependent methyltransferase/uncharacterized protein YbaR (Trm112 family)